MKVLFLTDCFGAHALQVLGWDLAIDKFQTEPLCQKNQGDLGRIGNEGKHALSTEYLANLNAVKTSHEFLALPHLDAVRKSFAVQLAVSLLHVIHDPGAILIFTRHRSAVLDDPIKGRIAAYPEFSGPQNLLHALGDLQSLWIQDESIVWCVP